MKQVQILGRLLPIAPLCLIVLGAALWPELELLVPSLPAMKIFFDVSDGEIQQLLSANFLGFLLGVLFAGPLCDSFGRKKTAVWGMLFFLLASAFAALAQDFSSLMAARFIQGLAVTAPIIGSITMLLEITAGPRQIFWMSVSSASVTLCMAGAPLVGAYINTELGFRANLWAIFMVAFLGILPVIFWVPESLPPEKRASLRISTIIKGYVQILQNPKFLRLALVVSALPAAYWIYTGVSALYMVDFLGLDPALFGWYQAPIVATFAVLSMSITAIHKRYSVRTCLLWGFGAMLLGSGGIFILSMLKIESPFITMVCMMLFAGGEVPANSLLFPSALNLLPTQLQGSGQSMIQALRLLVASIGTVILGVVYTGSFLPVAIILLVILATCAILLWKMRHLLTNASGTEIITAH